MKSQLVSSWKCAKHLASTCVIISDEIVAPLYAHAIKNEMENEGLIVHLFTFPAGESSKTRQTKEKLEDEMMRKKIGRDTLLLAIGGGVVTDLAGFVAATYCRGIPYISMPTTLLAMVDAAIGGKVGVNTPWGKNLIGAFHPPEMIVIDESVLSTLPEAERLNGEAEIIKYGLIAHKDLLEKPLSKELITSCIELKQKIVALDPYEKNVRKILNFGHTFGHAIETASHYQMSHGQAVALGMVLESLLSCKMGLLQRSEYEQIFSHIKTRGFDLKLPKKHDEILAAMAHDKKALNQKPQTILLEAIGKATSHCYPIDTNLALEVLHEID